MIIGISGKMHSGKDTFAGYLKTELKSVGQTYETRAFGTKLKKLGADLTNTPLEWWYSIEGKAKVLDGWNMTIGEFQQKLGTEAIRNGIHKDSWIFALFSEYYFYSKWIITDVRLLNEAEAIKSRGGILVRLEGDPARLRASSTRDHKHESETALDNYKDFDYTIYNTPPTSFLQKQAKDLVSCLLNRQKSNNIEK